MKWIKLWWKMFNTPEASVGLWTGLFVIFILCPIILNSILYLIRN